MPIDKQLVFCENQDVSNGASVPSTNVIYFPKVYDGVSTSTVNDRPGASGRVYLSIMVGDTGFTSDAGNKSCEVQLFMHTSDVNVTTAGVKVMSIPFTVDNAGANYPAGKVISKVSLPMMQLQPYLQTTFVESTNGIATGKLTVVLGTQTYEG